MLNFRGLHAAASLKQWVRKAVADAFANFRGLHAAASLKHRITASA